MCRKLADTRYRVEGWRDNKEKIYTTKGAFSLIGDFELCDSRRRVGVGSRKQRFVRDRTTSFVYWGPVLFESFQSGYIKKLDFAAVRSLRHTAAKRLYRYLDKYFNPPAVAKLCFDLNELAYLQSASVNRRTMRQSDANSSLQSPSSKRMVSLNRRRGKLAAEK